MPKMKTKSSAKKRFLVTGRGKVKSKQAFSRHMMTNKSKSMKRKARGTGVLFKADQEKIRNHYMPYARRARKAKALAKIGKGEAA